MPRRRRVRAIALVTASVLCFAALVTVGASPAAAAVTITGFAPTRGAVGVAVTITGTGFAAGDRVTIGQKPAAISSLTPTRIIAAVPAGASSGPVTVADAAGTIVASGTFDVTTGICCGRTVAPASSFPLNGTAFSAFGLAEVTLRDHGNVVASLASPTTDSVGSFTIASLSLPPSVMPGDYDLVVVQDRMAASVPLHVQAGWFAPGGSARNRATQLFEGTLTRDNIKDIDLDWSVDTGSISAPPVIAGGLIVMKQGADVVAVSAADGRPVWRVTVPGSSPRSPVLVGTTLYVADANGAVRALRLSTGGLLWTSTCGGCPATTSGGIAAADGVVALDTSDGIRAYAAGTGAHLWSAPWGGGFDAGYDVTADTSEITIGAGAVIQQRGATLNAWDLETGGVLWQVPASHSNTSGSVFTTPVSVGRVYYVDAAGHPALAYLSSGHTVSGSVSALRGSFPIVHDVAYFSGDGSASAGGVGLSASTLGHVMDMTIMDVATVANGMVLSALSSTAGGDAYAIISDAATGEVLIYFAVINEVGAPIVVDGVVYVVSNPTHGGRIEAYDLAGGRR